MVVHDSIDDATGVAKIYETLALITHHLLTSSSTMSLLRSVLRNNQKRGDAPFDPGAPTPSGKKKGYASSVVSSSMSSIRSASAASFKSVATTIASMVSFYSMITGGSKIPKRRRPEVLKFGQATFANRKPPPAIPVPGAERIAPMTGPFTAAHSVPALDIKSSGEPALSIVLYSYARPSESMPMYHDRAVVTGEVRMFLKKPKAVGQIDVWVSRIR